MENDFTKEKVEILKVFSNIEKATAAVNFTLSESVSGNSLLQSYNETIHKLRNEIANYITGSYPVAILGRWNSGKSTLLNTMIGKELLPTDICEMTSIITRIKYGKVFCIKVLKKNDIEIIISENELYDYITLQGKHYSDDILEVIIFTDSDLLKNGVEFVDTPGLDSVSELNNNLSYQIIPTVSAIIVTLKYNDVGGKSNFDLVKKVFELNFNKSYNVIFTITAIDCVNEKQLSRVEDSLLELIKKVNNLLNRDNDNFTICKTSAYYELKYDMYTNGLLHIDDIVNDSILRVTDVNDIEKLHKNSHFEEFKTTLYDSILNSNRRINQLQHILIAMNGAIYTLIRNINNYLNLFENSRSLQELSNKLDYQINEVKKIEREGLACVQEFIDYINKINNNRFKKSDEFMTSVRIKIANYINNTDDLILSANKYKDLEREVINVFESCFFEYLNIENGLMKMHLKVTIDKICLLIENADISSSIEDQDVAKELNLHGLKIKSSSFLAPTLISIATSIPTVPAGFFVGNLILPGLGGMIGGAITALLNFIANFARTTDTENKKVVLMKGINNYINKQDFNFTIAIKESSDHYLKAADNLSCYLNNLILEKEQEKNHITELWQNEKKQIERMIIKLKHDLNNCNELCRDINNCMGKYL